MLYKHNDLQLLLKVSRLLLNVTRLLLIVTWLLLDVSRLLLNVTWLLLTVTNYFKSDFPLLYTLKKLLLLLLKWPGYF